VKLNRKRKCSLACVAGWDCRVQTNDSISLRSSCSSHCTAVTGVL